MKPLSEKMKYKKKKYLKDIKIKAKQYGRKLSLQS